MPIESGKNGRGLERAVRFIQESILKSDPKLKGTGFSIEANKIVTVSGVHHEIDAHVKTLPGSPYESTFIFECKDWKKPVGKNEVIVLAEKVAAVHANHGFLVARRLTKDAQAQIALDSRLRFIPCTDDFESPLNNLQLVLLSHEILPVKVGLKERGVAASPDPRDLEWRDKECLLKGKVIDLRAFLKQHVDEATARDRQENAPQYREESGHFRQSFEKIVFDPGEFLIGDLELEYIVVEIQFFVNVGTQQIHSRFELAHQGQAFSFAPVHDVISGTALEIQVVRRV